MPKGIQDGETLEIDVVFTKLGRFYKSIGSQFAEPVKFALSDDWVDYRQFDPNLPTANQGIKIERVPLFEAFTDETSLMKNKLITLPRNTTEVATMELSATQLAFNVRGNQVERITKTININVGFSSTNGFTVRIRDSKYLYLNQPPTMDQTSMLIISDPNNLVPQQIRVDGSAQIPFTANFEVTYDATRARFNTLEHYRTKIIVESLDAGYVKEVDVVLSVT
jgi:hypothetical protein